MKMWKFYIVLVLLTVSKLVLAGTNTGLRGDDVSTGPLPIGFTFNYYGKPYTQFYPSTNGLIGFSSGSTAYTNSCTPELANTLYVFWDDLRTDVSGQPEGKIEYETIGEAPNRKLIVQWTNQYFYGDNLPMGTFQAILYEGSDEIKYQYRNLIQERSKGNSATISMLGNNSSQYTQVSCVQNTLNQEKSILFTPDAARTSYTVNMSASYEFLDISGLTPLPPLTTKTVWKDSITWKWTKVPSLNTYEIVIQTLAGTVVHSAILGNVDSFTLSSGVVHGESYIAKIRGSVNSGATWELWSGFSTAVLSDQVAPTAVINVFYQQGYKEFDIAFQVNDDKSGVASQALQLSLDSEFTSLILNEEIPTYLRQYRYNDGEPGQRIYARLVAHDRAGNQTISATKDVVVVPPPVAAFTTNVESGEAVLDVNFTSQSQGPIHTYAWDFGNSQTSYQVNPTATYKLPGNYLVKLTVSGQGGSSEATKTVVVTPDLSGPTIIQSTFTTGSTNLELANGTTLTQSGKFIIKATDKSKISRVVFTLNNEPLGNVLITNATGAYEQSLDLLSMEDGSYTLGVKVYDMVENVTERNYSFSVDLSAPAVPTITAPMQNATINQLSTSLSGKAAAGTEVMFAVNGSDLTDVTAVDSTGNYSAVISLVENANNVKVKARYIGRTKWSAYSAERIINVNTQIPDAPKGFSVTAAKQGQVHLQWSAVTSSNTNNQVKGYKVYRAATSFANKTDAGVAALNSNQLITETTFTNTVAADGHYFYAVAAVNHANNESALSTVLSATTDSIGPKITQLTFTPEGEFDAANAIYGRGRVLVSATFSEPLRNAPYFAVVPEAGLPISIDLAKSYNDEVVYTGQFTIDQSTASGTAYAAMSAFDNPGNRGTDIQQNGSLKIDTKGPDIAQLSITPSAPLKVDAANGLHVNVSIRLSEETKAGTQVKLVPMIDGVPLIGYGQGITLVAGADNLNLVGEFYLPNTVAQSSSAQLSFAHAAVDGLNNPSQTIIGQNQFQVYQGNLPPLNTPGDLTSTALPGGKIKLTWRTVEKAAGYVLYRQGPNDSALIALPPLTAIEYEDQTIEDGTYLYAIASVRRDNGQESESVKSATISVKADRVAPAKPGDFDLELNGAGIVARWSAPVVDAQNAPQAQQGLTYKLYRTSLPQNAVVTDASVYTPIQTNIPALVALDTKPVADQHSYFVTAVDAAGNESAPSNTDYLNAGLLPVNQLHITLDNNGYPQISWQHQGNGIDSYRVLRKTGDAEAELLTPEGIAHQGTNSSYTDTTYNGNQASKGANHEVVYSVIAVDANEVESVPHELRLPALSVVLERNKPVLLERGVMNQLWFRVDNKGASAADGVRLYVTLTENGQQREHSSEMINIAAGANQLVAVVVGGYDKLDAITHLSLRLEQKPQTNQRIRIYQSEMVDVGTSSLTVDLNTQNFTRGGAGKVSFNLTNNSDVETELVMATNNSNADSTEVRLILEDLQGNLLTRKTIRQTTGGVVNVPSGQTVARIAAKGLFSSEDFTINIPAAAPDQVRLRLVVDKYHYQLGKENHVEISGIGVSKDIQLIDTPYFAEATSVQPATVNAKTGTVTISGRAIDRTTNQPLANVPVSIITTVRGFERISTVYSDASGNYVFGYKVDGTAGKYRVSAVHPEMTDRPNQGEFTAEGGSVSPVDIDAKIARNYVQEIKLRVRADQETTLSNVRLVQIPSGMQTVAELPPGVTVNYTALASVAANSSKDLVLTVQGDNTAADKGLISYRVEADNHIGANALGTVNISYELSASAPGVKFAPNVVDTGVNLDQSIYEDVIVTNSGLQPLNNARVKLIAKDNAELPTWISLKTAVGLGDIPVGESRQVQIAIEPKTGVADSRYEFKLIVEGDNLSSVRDIPVFVNVTPSGKGKIAFKISDIYTKTKDVNEQIIEGVNNARIQLQNENLLTFTTSKNTDANGEVLFEELPVGRYSYRVSANDHVSISGRIWIKPDVTGLEKVFLMNNLINVEWSVREITVEDRYEIKLEAIFKTNVPAPVVILNPMAVNLPVMKKGDVFQGEFTLTNHGLIRAYNLKEGLPATNDLVRVEFLKETPKALEPGQVFILPYRVYALRDFNPVTEAAATGGGCGTYVGNYSVTYQGRCINDAVVSGQASAKFSSNWGSCGSSGGDNVKKVIGGSSGRNDDVLGPWGNIGPAGSSAEPLWCIADTECDDCNKGNGSAK